MVVRGGRMVVLHRLLMHQITPSSIFRSTASGSTFPNSAAAPQGKALS